MDLIYTVWLHFLSLLINRLTMLPIFRLIKSWQAYINIYIYIQFKCPSGECISNNKKTQNYISHTTTKLSKRFTLHQIDFSSICQHFKKYYSLTATYRNIFVDNTKILHTDNNVKKLKILEALYIKFKWLTINRINFETSDNILKCLKSTEQSIFQNS